MKIDIYLNFYENVSLTNFFLCVKNIDPLVITFKNISILYLFFAKKKHTIK